MKIFTFHSMYFFVDHEQKPNRFEPREKTAAEQKTWNHTGAWALEFVVADTVGKLIAKRYPAGEKMHAVFSGYLSNFECKMRSRDFSVHR